MGNVSRNSRIYLSKGKNLDEGSKLIPSSLKAKGKESRKGGWKYTGSVCVRAKLEIVANFGFQDGHGL